MIDTKFIRNTAKRIYREFETLNPFRICRLQGIIVTYASLGSLDAYYTKVYQIPVITINSDLEESEAIVACLHELGHIFLKHNENKVYCSQRVNMKVSPWEDAANTFVIEYLLLAIDPDEFFYRTKEQIAYVAGIPENLIHLMQI